MKKRIILTLIVAFCGITLILQRGQINKLKKDLTTRSTTLPHPRTYSPFLAPPRRKNTPLDLEKLAHKLPQLIPKENASQTAIFAALPDILTHLEDQSTDDLFHLLAILEGNLKKNPKEQSTDDIYQLLLVLMSQAEPEKILTYLAEKHSNHSGMSEMKLSALWALARKDPQKAQTFFQKTDWKGHLKQKAQMALFSGITHNDISEGLTYLDQASLNHSVASAILSTVIQETKNRQQLEQILKQGSHSRHHVLLQKSLLKIAYQDDRFQGLVEILPTLNFADKEARDSVLHSITTDTLNDAPEETLALLAREISEKNKNKMMGNAISNWAHSDFTAAGKWLTKQKPSPTKNFAISAYARTVTQLNPIVALEWIDEISAETLQKKSRQRVLIKWHTKDPQAAEAWITKQGWKTSDWLPKTDP